MMDALTELAEQVEAIPAPPCDSCNLRTKCARLRLACPEFFFYVNPPDTVLPEYIKDLLPTRQTYARTYPPNDGDISLYPARALSTEDKRAIRRDARTTRDVALWYQCSGNQVRALRQRANIQCEVAA